MNRMNEKNGRAGLQSESDLAFEFDPVFEADLRAVMVPEAAGAALRHRILVAATEKNRRSAGGLMGWLAALDPREWRFPALMELGAAAAAASLAIGIFAGANGLVTTATTTTVASTTDEQTAQVDLVALAYENSGVSATTVGDLQ
jgi:hypothetical protein